MWKKRRKQKGRTKKDTKKGKLIIKKNIRVKKGKKKRNQDGHNTMTPMDGKPTCLLCI
jgi:hypothetical protein